VVLQPIDKPSFMRGPAYSPPDGLTKEDLEYDLAAPRVYCFITRFPFFQLHFNMLYHLLGKWPLSQAPPLPLMSDPTSVTAHTHRAGEEEQR
jgi:hypothetical protein